MRKVVGFIVEEQRGIKFEGRVPVERFDDYKVDGKPVAINDMFNLGQIVRIRGAKIDEKMNKFEKLAD